MNFNLGIKFWIWPFLLALTLFIASGTNPVGGPDIVNFDKLVHFLVFGLIAATVVRCKKPVTWQWALITILLVSGYGFLDEFRQSFTPGRSVEWEDWLADTTGALTSVLFYKLVPAYSSILEMRLPSKSRQADLSKK